LKNHRFIAGFALASLSFLAAAANAATNDTSEAVADAAGSQSITTTTPATGSKTSVATGAEVVRGLQSLTPDQLDRVLARVDKFDDNTKRQFKDAVLHPTPFTTSLLTVAADRISPESRQQLADAIVKVKAGR
jgi:hypothetical protein